MNQWRIADWFKDLDTATVSNLYTYYQELIRFNPSLNLVSQKTLPFADVIHFSDSIIASRLIRDNFKGNNIIDIGSGNGFPGMVFGLLYPEIKVELVDRDQRKIEFLKHVVHTTGSKNINAVCKSIESYGDGQIEYAITRGFASIAKIALLLRKTVKAGGAVYMLKSEEWVREVSQIPTQLCSYWQPELISEYRLPQGEVKFSVVKLKKTAD